MAVLATAAACSAGAPAGAPAEVSVSSAARPDPAQEPKPRAPLKLTYLGVAGWQMTSGDVTILIDPHFSRPSLAADALMIPDEQAIRARVPPRVSLVLVAHSHVDHLLDAPSVARLTGAEIMGTASTANYARASGIPSDKIVTVKGGEDYAFNGFSVRVIPGLHSALDHKHTFGADTLIPANVKLPMRFADFAEGGSLAYLVRAGGHEVLFISSANYIERELEGIHPNVAVVATGLRQEVHDYTCRLMRVLGRPPVVFANHFDRWMEPIGPTANLSPETTADLARFGEEVRACASKTRVIVPGHFETHQVD
jgi:L-ascorbate metabolism protein UlaG (beta-lactamase superfamily)